MPLSPLTYPIATSVAVIGTDILIYFTQPQLLPPGSQSHPTYLDLCLEYFQRCRIRAHDLLEYSVARFWVKVFGRECALPVYHSIPGCFWESFTAAFQPNSSIRVVIQCRLCVIHHWPQVSTTYRIPYTTYLEVILRLLFYHRLL